MRRLLAMFLLVLFVGCGSLAYAKDSECDCDCKNGGLGIKVSRFVCGFGFKQFYSKPGCDSAIGLAVGLGAGDQNQLRIGAGFDQGVFGIGLTVKNDYKTTLIGFSVGLDYSDCRMVWPIEE
jgi:hypothetical protein